MTLATDEGPGALRAAGTARVGGRLLTLDLLAPPGEVVALIGPNGSGKSTTIDVLVGLRPLEGGTVRVGPHVLVDSAAGIDLPAADRLLGWAPQAPALLPRLRLHRQVAAFARPGRAPLVPDGHDVSTLLERLLLAPLADRRPGALSGGEAQRVAVARALAASNVVLLDEPTSAQDPDGARAVRAAIRAHVEGGGIAVVVAHRPEDAWLLADRVCVLEDLAVVQRGHPDELGARPATPYVAQVAGATVLRGDVGADHLLRTPDGDVVVGDLVAPGPAVVVIRPEHVTLHRTVPAGSSARNVVRAVVTSLDQSPTGIRVRLDGRPAIVAAVTSQAVQELDLRPGESVWATWKANDVEVLAR